MISPPPPLARCLRSALCLAACLAVISPVAAADLTSLSLEDLLTVEVSTASKYKQDAREAPSNVQVISAEDIQRYGWRTVNEALNSLTGFYTSDDRAYQYLGSRGFLIAGDYNTRFLLQLNGQRLNDNLFEQGLTGFAFPLDLALVDRIEVVSGPGSAIYGSNALFGVINVIARQPSERASTQASATVTTDGWNEVRASQTRRLGEDGPALLASVTRGEKGPRDLKLSGAVGATQSDGSTSADGVARGLDLSTHTRAYLALQQSGLQLSAWASQRKVQPSTALYGTTFNDRRLNLNDNLYGIAATLERTLESDLQFTGKLAYQQQEYVGTYPYPSGGSSELTRDQFSGGWWSADSRFLYNGFAGHRLLYGADLQQDTRASMVNSNLSTATSVLDYQQSAWRTGVYLQDEWAFAPQWRLSAGARFDRYSSDRSATTPRIGLVYLPNERNTFKLLAGEAYRVPSAYEKHYNDGTYISNTALQAETIRTVEGIFERRLDQQQLLGMSLHQYQFKSLITQVDAGNSQLRYENQSGVSSKALELFWKKLRTNDASLFASISLNRVQVESGERFPNSPNWLAKFRATQALGSPLWIAALEVDAVGPRQIEATTGQVALGTQWWVNATVNTTALGRGVRLQWRVINLLDRQVQLVSPDAVTSFVPLNRRSLQMTLVYDW